jgi:hypothetical protein
VHHAIYHLRQSVFVSQKVDCLMSQPRWSVLCGIALNLSDIDVRVLHANLNNAEHQELIYKFNNNSDKIMILMCNYYVNSAESNLQTQCHNCHLFNISMSQVILMQVIDCYIIWARNSLSRYMNMLLMISSIQNNCSIISTR